MELHDCTAKEKLIIERYGGDVRLKFVDKDGKIKYDFLMQMKRNSPDIFKRIEKAFNIIKINIIERPLN